MTIAAPAKKSPLVAPILLQKQCFGLESRSFRVFQPLVFGSAVGRLFVVARPDARKGSSTLVYFLSFPDLLSDLSTTSITWGR
eukprot:scaffold260_cov390-Pavlova_lutheri.AAC.3